MKYQPSCDYSSNDDIQTPEQLAKRIVKHFAPSGLILEPCKGEGNFLKFMPGAQWCEIKEGKDFFKWQHHVDWIVTNPPWSQIRSFMQHAMTVSENIVFLMTVNHVWTKARVRDIYEAGYGIKEICLVEMPLTFPQSGFQLGAVQVARGWRGPITLSDISVQIRPKCSSENVVKRFPKLPSPSSIA